MLQLLCQRPNHFILLSQVDLKVFNLSLEQSVLSLSVISLFFEGYLILIQSLFLKSIDVGRYVLLPVLVCFGHAHRISRQMGCFGGLNALVD